MRNRVFLFISSPPSIGWFSVCVRDESGNQIQNYPKHPVRAVGCIRRKREGKKYTKSFSSSNRFRITVLNPLPNAGVASKKKPNMRCE